MIRKSKLGQKGLSAFQQLPFLPDNCVRCKDSFQPSLKFATEPIILVGLFVDVGYGLCGSSLGGSVIPLGIATGLAITAIFPCERSWRSTASRQPPCRPFETEDMMYLIDPMTWFDGLRPFLVLTVPGTPVHAAHTLWHSCDLLVHQRIQRIQLTVHSLIGGASTFTNRPDRSVCVDALRPGSSP